MSLASNLIAGIWGMVILFLASSCGNTAGPYSPGHEAEDEKVEITHFNITIVPDLSNRVDNDLYTRQLHDTTIIRSILEFIPAMTQSNGRLVMQKDKVTLRLLNPFDIQNYDLLQPKLTIDLGQFGDKQNERIRYLGNRTKEGNNLTDDIDTFVETAGGIYDTAGNKGFTADLWGFFKQTVDPYYFNLSNPINSPKARDKSRNILILLTDGYIDMANQNSKSCSDRTCKWLNAYQIQGFRKSCNCDGTEANLQEIFDQSGYGLLPVNNPSLNDVEVLMLEVFDRSKSESGRITKDPSDFQILQLFWSDFFEKSGVKHYEIVEAADSKAKLNEVLKAFLLDFQNM